MVGIGEANALVVLGLNGSKRLIPTSGVTWDADWSPDGRWISFITDNEDAADDLMLVHPDGSGLRRLIGTEDPEATEPCCVRWSPDGRRLLFIWPDQTLRILDLKTDRVRIFARDVSQWITPAWSPDGSAIAYVTVDFVEDEGPYEGSFLPTDDLWLGHLHGGRRLIIHGGRTLGTLTELHHIDWARPIRR